MSKKKQIDFPFNSFYRGINLIVLGYFEDTPKEELKEGAVYVYDECMWRYYKSLPENFTVYPAISYDNGGDIVTQRSILDESVSIDTVLKDRLKIICDHTTEDMDFSKDVSIIPAASSTAIYMPEISEKDDFLKKILKTIFRIKKVATTKYRKKLSKAYAFSNLFQGLNSDTKISTTVWQTWIEILGVDCMIIVKDSGTDNEDAIHDYIVYKSRNDTISVVEKDKNNEFLSENL